MNNPLSVRQPVRLLQPARTRLVQELRHTGPLLSCRFDPSGRFVFAGGQENSIQRWDLATGAKVTLEGHRSWVRALTFVPGQNLLISGAYNGQVLWWPVDAATPRPLRTLDAHQGWVRALALSPDGQTLATCGNDHLVKLWSSRDGTLLRELRGHTSHVYNVAFHPGGTHLASGDMRGVVKDWELASGTEVRSLDASVLCRFDNTFRADIGGVRSMAFNGTGSLLACAGITEVSNAFAGIGRPGVVLFNWQTGARQQLLRPAEAFQGTAWGVSFVQPDLLAGAAGGNGGMLYFWRPDQANSVATVRLPNNARDLALHPDGCRLAVPCFDGVVRIYDMTLAV